MRNVDTNKISKEVNDTLVHRACVMRSGKYLSRFLIHCNRSVDAIRLLARCSVHDISKIQNMDEFLSLASIIDQMGSMQDVSHVLSSSQQEAIRLHWENNSHHPEHYENPNDMSDLDLMEMACDCHARSKQYKTNLLDYINKQQDLRFHFDKRHFYLLKKYCVVLTDLSKDDDYSIVFNDNFGIDLNFKDSTMKRLETFDDTCFVNSINGERIYLKKVENTDFASIVYKINLKETNNEIGFISLKFNGFIDLKIYQNYLGQGYGIETLKTIVNLANFDELFIDIRKENEEGKAVAEGAGFSKEYSTDSSDIYCLKRTLKNKKV